MAMWCLLCDLCIKGPQRQGWAETACALTEVVCALSHALTEAVCALSRALTRDSVCALPMRNQKSIAGQQHLSPTAARMSSWAITSPNESDWAWVGEGCEGVLRLGTSLMTMASICSCDSTREREMLFEDMSRGHLFNTGNITLAIAQCTADVPTQGCIGPKCEVAAAHHLQAVPNYGENIICRSEWRGQATCCWYVSETSPRLRKTRPSHGDAEPWPGSGQGQATGSPYLSQWSHGHWQCQASLLLSPA